MVICGNCYNLTMEANRLKELRVKAGLTLRQLSNYTKIDYSYLSKIEKGQKVLTKEMALKLSLFFSVDANYVEGKKYYLITCHTSNLKQTFSLFPEDIRKYGDCYDSKLTKDLKIINVINKNIEERLLKEKEMIRKTLNKLLTEKEIVDSMDDWAPINLMYAQAKINELLNKKR